MTIHHDEMICNWMKNAKDAICYDDSAYAASVLC